MTFQQTADRPGRFSNIPRQSDAGRWDVMIEIGYDPDIPVTYYFSVHTYPCEGSHEFGFCVAWSFNATGKWDRTYESEVVKQLFPRETREIIRGWLWHYTAILVEAASHDAFFMETYTPWLEPKVLEKYDRLNEIFASLGYLVTPTASVWAGKHKWVMTKREPQPGA